jgi:phenylacetate-CoA ligase
LIIIKKNIHEAFGDPFITELYGATEGLVISGTCENGNHHILTPHVYLELLDKNGNETKAGDWGYVVVTRLDAYTFPLIRYYLGDLAIKARDDERCACGRNFPLLKKIIGRDTDLVQTPSGKDLIVHFFTGIFEHFPAVTQFRVIQKEPGKIEIDYIPSPAFSTEVLSQIEQNMYSKANEYFPVCWRRVENIAPTKSGKPQIVQNLILGKPG